jgi:PIN domain nuclease of toxin-antitoxin system
VQAMPRIHGDPFDRLLIAQAQFEQIPLLTTETALFGQYGIQVIW